jgi:hypothetical protein
VADRIAGRTRAQHRQDRRLGQARPRLRADDPVHADPHRLLEAADRLLGRWAEAPVDAGVGQQLADDQRALPPANRLTG